MIDVPMLMKVRDKIAELPEIDFCARPLKGDGWTQSILALRNDCGTTACVAGWTCLLNEDLSFHGGDVFQNAFTTEAGEPITDRAQALLGIDNDQANDLFYGENTRAEVLGFMDQYIAQGEAERYPDEA